MDALIPSRGIRRIPHLHAFLPEYAGLHGRLDGDGGERIGAVLGWGYKRTSRRARAIARRHGLPYVALEDGFLRSFGLGGDGEPPLSLVVDPDGIYYDATRPSRLESLLEEGGWETPDVLERAWRCLERIRHHRLSKYNRAPDTDIATRLPTGRRILLVDQTVGDESVLRGRADAGRFLDMLDAAKWDERDASIVVKTHPDVIAGRKQGYLAERARARGHLVIGEEVNPWSVLEAVDAVYTVTSQLGFEALLAGRPVRCFGLPFYAGWGATRDVQSCHRRTRRRSVDEIFAAAYLVYARYADPFTGRPLRLEDAIERIVDLKRHHAGAERATVCLGFSPWKKRFVRGFVTTPDGPRPLFRRTCRGAVRAAARRGGRVVVWASAEPPALAPLAEAAGVELWRMEDGFLRSVGLGSDLVRPSSLVLDDAGIHFDAGRPSGLERLLNRGGFAPETLARAARLRERLIRLRLSKYNLADASMPQLPEDGRRRILVPGQVENDASVRLSGSLVRTNHALLKRVRAHNPDAVLVFKPHPDVACGNRPGRVADAEAHALCDTVAAGAPIADLIDAVDEVHTISSQTGFEALLRGKRVTCYGAPFYAGWGLTRDRVAMPRRARPASLDELVAATLILYPRYVDPVTGRPCPVEVVVDRLAEARTAGSSETALFRGLSRWLLPLVGWRGAAAGRAGAR